MKNELVIVEDVVAEGAAIAKILKPKMVDDILQRARDKYLAGLVADVTTKAGRDEIRNRAMKPVKAKTTIEKAGAEYSKWLKAEPKLVDAERKRLKDGFDAIRDEIRAPLTEWENIRKEIDNEIGYLHRLTNVHENESERIANAIEDLIYTSSDSIVEDKRKEYDEALQRALAAQFGFLAEAITAENDAEELERLRLEKEAKEAEEQKQKEIEEARVAAKKEAEEAAEKEILKAQLDKANAEKAAREAKEAEEQAKKDKQAAIDKAEKDKQAALEAERKRELDKKAKEEAEEAARQADEANRDNIHNAIRQALMDDGLNFGQAQVALDAIVGGRVPHVVIKY